MKVTDWVCPPHMEGATHSSFLDDRVIFACTGCRHPESCADAGSCERDTDLEAPSQGRPNADRRASTALMPDGSVGTPLEDS